jgi:type VI secretion system protein ImpA
LTGIEDYLRSVLQEREPAASAALESETPGDAASATPGPTSDAKPAASGALPPLNSVLDAAEALKAIEAYYGEFEPSSPSKLLIRQAQQLVGKSFIEAMQMLAPELASKSSIKIQGEAPFALSFERLKSLAGGEAPIAPSNNSPQVYKVATRAEAARLMSAVEAYYRAHEPSSPIPLLVERARLFVDKDFSSLLKEMLKQPEK